MISAMEENKGPQWAEGVEMRRKTLAEGVTCKQRPNVSFGRKLGEIYKGSLLLFFTAACDSVMT